jgi:hypothetical protein
MPSKGSLVTSSKRAVKVGCGGAGAAMIGCSAEQGVRLIYLTLNELHAVLGQKMRREQVFLLACGL